MKQETVSGSGISWAICKSAPCSRQITTPVPHHCFLQAGCPSCRPTNSVKALKARSYLCTYDYLASTQTVAISTMNSYHQFYLTSVKSRLVLSFWYQLTRVVPDKGPLNRCVCVCVVPVQSPMHTVTPF